MDNIFVIFESITLLSIWKALILMLLGLYVVFAGLMAKQISSMIRAVTMKDDVVIRILGIGNFLLAISVFLIAMMAL